MSPLVHFGLSFLPDPWQCKVEKSLAHFLKAIDLEVRPGADCQGRNQASSYRFANGELSGVVTLATAWHGIGHKVGLDYFSPISKINECSPLSILL